MGAAESKPSPDSQTTLPDCYDGLDFYEILCVSMDATHEDIKQAYYKRAKSTHPDKDSRPGAKERFQNLIEAYETLSSPEKRALYDLKRENEMNAAAETEFGDFGSNSTIPGEWKNCEEAPTRTAGWFEWLFPGSTWFSDPFARYDPKMYINRHKHLPLSQGISAIEIAEHFNFCIQNAAWKEGGRVPSLCTSLRNLFECIAYEEKRWQCNRVFPDFGRMNSVWCPDDGYDQHYVKDFYAFWLNFDTVKNFEWIHPYATYSNDPALLREVEKENRKVRGLTKNQYNGIVRAIVELLLVGDPRVATHIVMNHFKGRPQISMEEFCTQFITQSRKKGKVTRSEDASQTRGPTKNQRKKQRQRNKAKSKKS